MKSREVLSSFKMGSRTVGLNAPCFVIGEVAQSHDGSLGIAHAFIDAIANAGADAVKFQTHIASAESTPDEPWRVKFSLQDATRYDYWRRMEFTEEQWRGLKRHADERGLQFLSSPFSMEAVDMLDRLGLSAWKVASGEINNIPMFERMAQARVPFLISTGMSTLREIDEVVKWVRERDLQLVLLQTTSEYPCPPERVGLNLIPFFKERYGCPVGLSDHSGTIYPGLAATLLGIAVLEVHVTLSREMFGPDNQASITTGELHQLVEGIHFMERMLANPVDKSSLARQLAPLRKIFTKSVVAVEDLAAGTVIREEHLSLKKPGTGIPPSRLKELIGRRLRRNVMRDKKLLEDDLEEVD